VDMSRPPIELHVEELVLHGFASADRHRIADAVRAELARLLEERGLPGAREGDAAVARLDGGTVRLRDGAAPDEAGAAIARAVYGGIPR
jgi:hypothetical protein